MEFVNAWTSQNTFDVIHRKEGKVDLKSPIETVHDFILLRIVEKADILLLQMQNMSCINNDGRS